MEQSPTPRNVEARGGGFSFPVLSGGEAFSFSPPKAKKVAAARRRGRAQREGARRVAPPGTPRASARREADVGSRSVLG